MRGARDDVGGARPLPGTHDLERVNARLKDEFGGRQIRVRGAAKVMAHLMFGVLALTADQILKLAS